MISRTFKRVSRVFLLMSLVCITYTANATTVNNSEIAVRADSISKSFRLDDLKIGPFLESLQKFADDLQQKYPDGFQDPVDLNLKFDFNFDLRTSQPFLLIQVIYNTLSGEDGMVSQLKDKKIEKFDQKTLKKLKKQFTKRSNKEIKKLCKGDRQTQKELKHKIQKLLDGIQIKEK
ncbi:MAG: hypothetical protein IKW84_02985 [Bacteroidaceae bacterium]|nr:hypothetical protein [Bacteroidaceae bacterium]